MTWKCKHCGWESERETSCCLKHWEDVADKRESQAIGLLIAVVVFMLVIFFCLFMFLDFKEQ